MTKPKSSLMLPVVSSRASQSVRRESGPYVAQVRAPGTVLPPTNDLFARPNYVPKELARDTRVGSMIAYGLQSRGIST
jgi:hypothetical protein